MPIITRLERQKRHKERVSVYLDGQFAFGVPEMDAARLRLGQSLDEEAIATLRQQDAVERACGLAVRLLTSRPRAEQEIRQALRRHQTDEGVMELALERLRRQGYLDDVAFARYWVESRSAFKPLGLRALRYELRQKGVAAEVIDDVLSMWDETGQASEDSLAYQAAQRQLRKLRGHNERALRRALMAFWQRRGFSASASRQAWARLAEELRDAGFFRNSIADAVTSLEDD
ncbi:MAG: RecX family transcriptional regulator [Anaerolineae bacterium]|nr:RecX family transcriptional regulator [Anaerolineae bacterium]MDW8173855.1 RecX family transcriptional regulator [Anaerolineae bacterium]